jgi:hypothetical protein
MRDDDVPVGRDLKRISSRVPIRVSADMMPRGHLGPRRGEGKHRIGCWAEEASVATDSDPFAGDTPGKVEGARCCNPCGSRIRTTGASIVWWIRVVAGQFMAWEGERKRGRERSRSRCTGMVSRKCSVFVRIWLRRKMVQWRFPGPGSQANRRRPGVGHPTWVPTGVRNARRSQPTPDTTSRLCRSDPPQGVASRVGTPPIPLIGDISLDKHPSKL